MFSKSSECNIAVPNEYVYTETCATHEGFGTSPFCATMGQPLIYYCQTPQPKCRQRCDNVRRDNRNFFTKAFQWYTEEHVPHRDENAKKSTDVKGFANWLDSKYDQFLQDQFDSCGYKVKHTSITEAYRFQNEPCCETRRKKFRVKSPWRKKRGHKDTGDVTSKSSLHYIMKPKDISRPASETNDMSKAMMVSSEVVLSRYSHSCSSIRILREPSVAVMKRNQEAGQSSYSIKLNKNARTKSLSKMGPEQPKDVLCLCSKVTKKNAYTQSDPSPVKSPSKNAPKVETHAQTVPAKSPSKCIPKVETHSQTLPKSESPLQPAQNAAPCPCRPSKFTKISHPTKIEIEFETKPSHTLMESKCQCSKEIIPKSDAQSQFETDVKTCACGSDHSIRQEKSHIMPKTPEVHPYKCNHMDFVKFPLEPQLANQNQNQPNHCKSDHSIRQEKSQIMPKTLDVHPCKCNHMDFVKCPLEQPLTNQNQNQPNHCNQCIPCKKTTIVTDDGKITNPSNKTTPGLDSNPSNKKTTGGDEIPAAKSRIQQQIPTTTNDGVQTSNQTTIANDGVQTSNHSIRIDKDGAAGAYPLFMKIVFADKLCKF